MKKDLYMSNRDLEFFLNSQPYNTNNVFIEEEITSIHELFTGDNIHAILFLKNEGSDIGHWVLLSKIDDNNLEYFDCLGYRPPEHLSNVIVNDGFDCLYSDVKLMADTGTICGKYVISRILSGNTSLKNYVEMLTNNKLYYPDEIIDAMYKFNY